MRVRALMLWDLCFQAKYGFYFLYAILTLIYTIALSVIPQLWQEKVATILIYSDPASMGLFFMGAIVLLEKSQRVPNALAISPVHPAEYVIAEVTSLSAISLVVAGIISIMANVDQLYLVLLGTLISSTIFTLIGIMIATKIASLNQFILWTMPVEIVCFLPAVLHLFHMTPTWFTYYPFIACIKMISGQMPSFPEFLIVLAVIVTTFHFANVCVSNMWSNMGGVKL